MLLELQEFEIPRISRKPAYEGGKVVRLRHWSPLPPQEITMTHISVSG
jgi:hypothetical protein